MRYAVSLIPWYDVSRTTNCQSRIVNHESIRTRFITRQTSPPVCWSVVLHPVSSSSSRSTEERSEYRNAPDEISLVPREYADSSRYESGEISFESQSLEPEKTCEYYDVETIGERHTRHGSCFLSLERLPGLRIEGIFEGDDDFRREFRVAFSPDEPRLSQR